VEEEVSKSIIALAAEDMSELSDLKQRSFEEAISNTLKSVLNSQID
jgi:hypothetical protein